MLGPGWRAWSFDDVRRRLVMVYNVIIAKAGQKISVLAINNAMEDVFMLDVMKSRRFFHTRRI